MTYMYTKHKGKSAQETYIHSKFFTRYTQSDSEWVQDNHTVKGKKTFNEAVT